MGYLSDKELNIINRYFRAANYLSVGQLYLVDNPLLKRPLELKDIKPRIVGHFGTTTGQNFIYTHLNRIITKYDLNVMYIAGPGHGGNAFTANTYLEGSYTEMYPEISQNEEGMKKFFKRFSFPGGVSSHASPEVPGSIHEGGELGYSLVHAYGAVLDNPDLICACVVGDGEAETGPLATSWHLNKFMNKKSDGVVLPILHLNGYKINSPTILSRMGNEDLIKMFSSYGYEAYYIEGDNPLEMHDRMAALMDIIVKRIYEYKNGDNNKLPMIIFRTPKGWTGPKMVDGKPLEGSFRSHQIPLKIDKNDPSNLISLNIWLNSYKPNELFDENGSLMDDIKEIIPKGNKRIGMNIHSNPGIIKKLDLPDYKEYLYEFLPGTLVKQDMLELSRYLRDTIILNRDNFRLFSPDENLSNRLNYVFESTDRKWNSLILPTDENLSPDGMVFDSFLSEHICEGLLEGYLLTGRHGILDSYESFIRVVDSMVSEHAKWLKMASEIPWRKEISSLNFILTSHVWQQDHNGFTHQDPGFLNHLVTKKSDMVGIYLPPDTNTLIACMNEVLESTNKINAIVASKHPRMQWFSKELAIKLVEDGIMIVPFASDDDPDVILCASGDTPTLEVFAAYQLLKENIDVKVRVVNIVDLMKLSPKYKFGLSDSKFEEIFTKDRPIIFAFHGYPNLIHELVYKRVNDFHVHGYLEEGSITTPFDMRVLNKIDRYHLVLDALKYIPNDEAEEKLRQYCLDMLEKHKKHIVEYGTDIDEVENFKWNIKNTK